MHVFKQTRWLPVFMAITIAGIAAFQIYWLRKTYEREARTLEIRSNMAFRETVHHLQAAKLKLDQLNDTLQFSRVRVPGNVKAPSNTKLVPNERMLNLVNVLNERLKDTVDGRTIIFTEKLPSDERPDRPNNRRQRNRLMQFLYDIDSLQDSVTVKEISTAYRARMQEQSINVPFTITRILKAPSEERDYSAVSIGFKNPITYHLQLHDTFAYLARRIIASILLSVFIVGFTIVSFWLLYRNLLRERRLADIKNEFISNITHELKTPIATVSVAIEAMRSFNSNMDAAKSKEYLDISANELQRLSLLVDKVLKLSMFEKKEVELRYEPLDMKALVDEVTSSMRLQSEKHKAVVTVTTDNDTTLQGDRLHLVSVVFNLLDNALKYSNDAPKINIAIKGCNDKLKLCVSDNGIGIPLEYREKVFDKFFRVPTGNLHNAKGYGLGLSYVAHVVKKHHGVIQVATSDTGGSTFVISLPKQPA